MSYGWMRGTMGGWMQLGDSLLFLFIGEDIAKGTGQRMLAAREEGGEEQTLAIVAYDFN